MSAAGGPHNALEAAAALGMEACQLFTKNNQQWKAAPLQDETIRTFAQTWERVGLQCALAHASYLLNLATKNDELWKKSIAALVDELHRADQLKLQYLVVHPGTASDEDEKEALHRVAAAVDAALGELPKLKTKLLLETTAGQGKCIGHTFRHLGRILKKAKRGKKVGVCLDTCHIFAAGYALAPASDYRQTMQEFDDEIGLDRLAVLHVNDSVKGLGCRVDRHAHVGHGSIGVEGFCNVVTDPRFQELPLILETPKGPNADKEEWDVVNLRTLRNLCQTRR
jgi:deoxyribonuclease-4